MRVRVGRGVPARAVVVEVLVGPRGASPLAPGEHLLPERAQHPQLVRVVRQLPYRVVHLELETGRVGLG